MEKTRTSAASMMGDAGGRMGGRGGLVWKVRCVCVAQG